LNQTSLKLLETQFTSVLTHLIKNTLRSDLLQIFPTLSFIQPASVTFFAIIPLKLASIGMMYKFIRSKLWDIEPQPLVPVRTTLSRISGGTNDEFLDFQTSEVFQTFEDATLCLNSVMDPISYVCRSETAVRGSLFLR
jgi:hypothetical protein